jgi:signal transduction histidine kinase/ActR/RegA family two-component response regulator
MQAENAQRFLAEAGKLLAASLDHETTTDRIARLAVPILSDWCIVDLVEDGQLRRVSVAYADPADEALAEQIKVERSDPDTPRGMWHVVKTGQSVLLEEVDEATIRHAASNVEHLAFLRQLRLCSHLCVPLIAHGNVLGTMTLLSTHSRRRFGAVEVALCEDLASRAALAVENARLYREAQAMRALAQAEARRASLLDRVNTLFNSTFEHDATLSSLADLALETLGDWCAIHILEDDGAVRRLKIAHADPELVRELYDRWPVAERSPPRGCLAEVLRTGEPFLAQEVTPELVRAYGRDETHVALLEQIGMRSLMVVPLRSRGRLLGTIGVATTDARRYGPCDLSLAVEVANRAALAIDNARLYQQLEEVCRAKDDFLAMVSHDLRTPLSSIMLWCDLLRGAEPEPRVIARAVEAIQSGARAQAKLIDDLLDVSRVVAGTLRLSARDVRIELLVDEALQLMRPSADARRITIEFSVEGTPLRVHADPARLLQVLVNLLSNAIKFSNEGGEVHVRLRWSEDHLRLSVEDAGRGISPHFLPHVFDRFRQADDAPHASGTGLGLGLTIVQHLVHLHGGSVHAASLGLGQGATFTVELPGEEAGELDGEEAARPRLDTEAALRGVEVLLVDDEPSILDVVTAFLESLGACVVTARSAAEALRRLDERVPQLLITDISMPDADGYQLLQEVRARPASRGGEVPAVALTAHARPQDRERSLQAGFQAHLGKPIDMGAFIRTVVQVAHGGCSLGAGATTDRRLTAVKS